MANTVPKLFIIESLDLEDEADHREGEVISRVLRMAGSKPIYRYVRTEQELIRFVEEFRERRYRWLHISVHGNHNLISLTLDQLNAKQFAKIVGPALADGRRLFLSTCKAATVDLASAIFGHGGCLSVLGPIKKIQFDDSAIFWSSFYHLMFKRKRSRMLGRDMEEVIAMMGDAVGRQFRLLKPGLAGQATETKLPKRLTKGKKK
ncbi:hypothetical protein M2333_003111 [Sphingobium sp. B11D3B]|uniref:hypothetical protein n=1 Tax=Sphingobium sp. B11D3B TaxID=2940575 RepID=UPI0022266D45|nr:hypothetical protein [Sphingobium sp. B11D3B]MCW2390065.1 hypothetical protein [Sphingobium sp. B11D3B]